MYWWVELTGVSWRGSELTRGRLVDMSSVSVRVDWCIVTLEVVDMWEVGWRVLVGGVDWGIVTGKGVNLWDVVRHGFGVGLCWLVYRYVGGSRHMGGGLMCTSGWSWLGFTRCVQFWHGIVCIWGCWRKFSLNQEIIVDRGCCVITWSCLWCWQGLLWRGRQLTIGIVDMS